MGDMCTNTVGTAPRDPVKIPSVRTVGMNFDAKIKESREYIQALCVAKAKAEVLGLLDMPYHDLREIIFPASPF